jgi:LPXTG-motif cell wall-anchored protein
MWSLGTSAAIFLFFGLIVVLAIVGGLLLARWRNRDNDKYL